MVDIGYFEQVEGGTYGRANPTTDSSPESRAQLQEASAARQRERTTTPGFIPHSYEHLGGGNVATIGWTAQSPQGPVFPPYSTEHIGRIPDWNADGIPSAGGNYDMTQVVAYGDYNPLNRAPIGDAVMQYDDTPNPNAPTTDVSGQIDLEW
jgi:hypothetical protein